MVLNQHELIYDKYWKEKWENIKEYKIYDDVLKIETKNNHTHTVKKIDSESLVIIEKIFTEKQIVKK